MTGRSLTLQAAGSRFSAVLLALFLSTVIGNSASYALPRFSLPRGEVSCGGCHVNPTGGGLRTAGGESYQMNRLPMWKRGGKFSGQISDGIRIGADYRSQFMSFSNKMPTWNETTDETTNITTYTVRGDTTTNVNGFFAMALPVYIGADLTASSSLYAKYDMINSDYEAWGIMHFVHGSGEILESTDEIVDAYLKIGAFLPSFGIRFDDHTAYTRGGNAGRSAFEKDGLWWAPNYKDVGAELGINLFDHFFLTADLLNGNETSPRSAFQTHIDNSYAYALKGVFGLEIVEDLLGGEVGASLYNHKYNYPNSTGLADTTPTMNFLGVHGGLHIGPVSFLAEYDMGKYLRKSGNEPRDEAKAFNVEATGFITDGLIAIARYETYSEIFKRNLMNADSTFSVRDVDGFNVKNRISLGFQWFPIRNFEFRPEYRIAKRDMPNVATGGGLGMAQQPGGTVAPERIETTETTFLLQTHIYF